MQGKAIVNIDKNGKVKLDNLFLIPRTEEFNTCIAVMNDDIEFESTEITECIFTCDSKKYIELYFAESLWKRVKFAFKLVFGFYKFKMPKEWLLKTN